MGCCEGQCGSDNPRGPVLEVKKLVPEAILPTKTNESDEGFDLYCLEDFEIGDSETVLVSTGISARVSYPNGLYGAFWLQIEGRSGLATKGISPTGGIIDSSYIGEIKVVLNKVNKTNTTHKFKKGDKVAQLVIRQHISANVLEVDDLDPYDESERSDSGFGSSGR